MINECRKIYYAIRKKVPRLELMNIETPLLYWVNAKCAFKEESPILYFAECGNICCNFRLDKCKLEQKSKYQIETFIILDKCKVYTYRSAN